MDPGSTLSAFLFGALSFISPCVLPLLPGYLSLMSGYSVSDLQEGRAGTLRMLRATLLFVAGFTAVFMAAGAGATALGGFLVRNQRLTSRISGWLIIIFGAIIVALALSATGMGNRKVMRRRSETEDETVVHSSEGESVKPVAVSLRSKSVGDRLRTLSTGLAFLARERRLEVRPSRLGGWAPPVMGMAFGFGWTPCIGPVLGAILTLAAAQETVGRGIWLLFIYSMGLGIPFVLAGIGLTKLYSGIRALHKYLLPINIASGLLMIGFGVLFVTGRITVLSGWISDFLIRIGLEWLAVI